MNILKIILLFGLFQIIQTTLFAQKIIDSIKICEYPVKEGTVYEFADSGRSLHGWDQSVSILTKHDSVFHIGQGEVIGIHLYRDGCAIVIRNDKDEYVSYGNLKLTNLCKGDPVEKGTFLGLAGKNEEGNYQQVDFMLFKKSNRLSFKKEVEYIRCHIVCEQLKVNNL
jgi:hypothetical protein